MEILHSPKELKFIDICGFFRKATCSGNSFPEIPGDVLVLTSTPFGNVKLNGGRFPKPPELAVRFNNFGVSHYGYTEDLFSFGDTITKVSQTGTSTSFKNYGGGIWRAEIQISRDTIGVSQKILEDIVGSELETARYYGETYENFYDIEMQLAA